MRAILPLAALLVSGLAFAETSSLSPGVLPSPTDLRAATPEESPSAPKVLAITIQGNRRVETEAVKAQIGTQVGQPLDTKQLQLDVRALWKMGFFSDVQIDQETESEGVRLVIVLTEKPSVREVRIEGNDELSKEDLKDEFEVKAFQIFNEESARKTAAKIQAKYVDKGFYLADVTFRADPKADNQVEVVFVVNEHAKVMVKEIRFLGAQAVSPADLKAVMQTQEGSFLSFLTSAGNYREEIFQRDLMVIQGVYYDRGYINIHVGKPVLSMSPDKRLLFITIPLEEGEPFDLGKIDFAGDLSRPKEELFALLQTRGNDRFSRTKLQHDLQMLGDLYKDEGYAYVNVSPETALHPAERKLDLVFDIQRGAKVTIEKIEFAGNDRTRDKVLRREMRVYEGELYSGTGINLSKQRVTALGYFESVDIEQKRGTTDDKMTLVVTVKEKPTGTFQVGFGFSNVEQFIGTAQIAQDNLFGWGITGSFNLQISSLRQLFQVSFLEPYFLDTKWTLSVDAYRTELFYPGFTRGAKGGTLTFGYELFEDFRVFGAYTLETVQVTPTIGTSPILADFFASGITSSVRFSFNWDKRDNRLFPTRGHVESASAEYATPFTLSQNLFSRYKLVERRYFPLPLGMVFKLNGTLSYLVSTDPNRPTIPISERFFQGGVNSLRGYNLLTVAPSVRVGAQLDPNSALVDFPIGGNKELLFQFEVEFPIAAQLGIRGVAFYDMGNAYAENENFLYLGSQKPGYIFGMLHDFGFGLRWFSPVGPLRFEWGIPFLTRRPQDEAYVFQFTIGNSF